VSSSHCASAFFFFSLLTRSYYVAQVWALNLCVSASWVLGLQARTIMPNHYLPFCIILSSTLLFINTHKPVLFFLNNKSESPGSCIIIYLTISYWWAFELFPVFG
jgi:hypothetical protein